ncbi:high choriolytic enzyme 1-like isoform X3 [Odontesthes bonariensis]|uniref:high choriolytic enzyme 1-like isoform X3 n=1 Tax=Odontesthes bonariensis TaxID=219752 RepID=UPI003F586C8D
MTPFASLLLLLLGLSMAQPLAQEEAQDEDQEEDQDVDITTRILTTNNGTDGFLWEGDLVAPTTRNAMKCWSNSCLWKKASNRKVMIPYVVSRQFPNHEKQKIQNAMRAFEGPTCIQFIPRRTEYDFITIVNKQGCYSALGRQGGTQELSLNRGGCMYGGIIQHELIHALGFQHEQTRSDRDNYVRINWGNIIQQSAYNFKKHDTNNLNTPYNYSSIMHYGKTAFSIGYGKETITPIPNPNVPIGQRRGMSSWDIKRINLLYRC